MTRAPAPRSLSSVDPTPAFPEAMRGAVQKRDPTDGIEATGGRPTPPHHGTRGATILGRLAQAVRDQNWTAIAVELAIVVVGVFLGIQATNWNAVREERGEQRSMQVRLRSDFQRMSQQIRQSKANHTQVIEALHTLTEAIARGAALPEEDEAIRRALGFGFSYQPMANRSATFIELSSSGRLDLVADEELRGVLVEHDRRAQLTRFNLEQIRNYMHTDMPNLNAYKDLGPLTRDDDGEIVLSPVTGYDIAGMAADRPFRDALELLLEMQMWVLLNMNAEQTEIATVCARLRCEDE